LLQKLIDSQFAFQDVLKHAIDDKQQQTDVLRWTIQSCSIASLLTSKIVIIILLINCEIIDIDENVMHQSGL